jgi:branched-chain amino acid transport system permease protein
LQVLSQCAPSHCARRSLFGPVAGAFLIVALENYLAQVGEWVLVTQGAIFVFCVLVFRRGIVGELARILGVTL